MKIGFVTIWFERGQSYVTRTIRDSLIACGAVKEEETFVFARTGGVYETPMLETDGYWAVPNLSTFGQYHIPPGVLIRWVEDNDIDHVIFNEEYDWGLVKALKEAGILCSTYLDYYKDDWKDNLQLYEAVLCSSERSYNMVKDHGPAHFISWAVDSELFAPRPKENGPAPFQFFHNAGWFGINMRKGTPAALIAYEAITRANPTASMLVHSQLDPFKHPGLSYLMQGLKKLKLPHLEWHVGTVPAPGLYHRAQCLVMPTKLEGLGLPLFEAMACGLPVIATNAPPMNEFIRDGATGWLVDVGRKEKRADGIAFEENIINTQELANLMFSLSTTPDLLEKAGTAAREYATTHLTLDAMGKRIAKALDLPTCKNKACCKL